MDVTIDYGDPGGRHGGGYGVSLLISYDPSQINPDGSHTITAIDGTAAGAKVTCLIAAGGFRSNDNEFFTSERGGPYFDENGLAYNVQESGGTTFSIRFVKEEGQYFTQQGGSAGFDDVSVALPKQAGTAFSVDGTSFPQTLVANNNPAFTNTATAAGSGSIVVDLYGHVGLGTVTRGGQLDATITGFNGVQAGAGQTSVLGLGSGTDLIYGGAGELDVTGRGASDIIQGGAGLNLVWGSTGSEIFYGNGGTDVVRGGSLANFMSGGPTSSSSDVFYGTSGSDFVYGNGGAVDLVGGTGSENLFAGSGFNEIDDRQQTAGSSVGLSDLAGSTGTDLFYGGVGTNLLTEGAGTDTFVGGSGLNNIYGGAGRSFIYGGSGTTNIAAGAGNQYIQAGSGFTYLDETAAHQTAGRFDQIDIFAGGEGTNLYLPSAVQGQTSFVQQAGGTAVLTAVNGGTAEIFASNTDLTTVQAHTQFTL